MCILFARWMLYRYVPILFPIKTFRKLLKILQDSSKTILWHISGYRMVFTSICEHARSAFIFASTSRDQICLASSEHFRKHLMTSSERLVNLTHANGQIAHATDNNCTAKTNFHIFSSIQMVSVSKLNLNPRQLFVFSFGLIWQQNYKQFCNEYFSDSGHSSDKQYYKNCGCKKPLFETFSIQSQTKTKR